MIIWNSTGRNWRTVIVVATGMLYVRNCGLFWITFLWTNFLSKYQSENCLEQSLRQQDSQYMRNVISKRIHVTVVAVDKR